MSTPCMVSEHLNFNDLLLNIYHYYIIDCFTSTPLFTAMCLFGDQSDGCIFECHCKTEASCDSQTGSCDSDGCADSNARDSRLQTAYKWRGPGCQIGE